MSIIGFEYYIIVFLSLIEIDSLFLGFLTENLESHFDSFYSALIVSYAVDSFEII